MPDAAINVSVRVGARLRQLDTRRLVMNTKLLDLPRVSIADFFHEDRECWACAESVGPDQPRSFLAARMFTKWSNFAKPKQRRAKARDYELGKTFRHTRSRGL